MKLYVEGIGLCGPGLDGWANSAPVLAGVRDYVPAPTSVPAGTLLPANERRRAARIVKIALAAGAEAFAAAARGPDETATVFASSGGDGDTIHEILTVLAASGTELSPTKFHNSVHNAPAGYWSIAAGARTAATSLCCHDDSFAAGLLEAGVQVVAGGHQLILIAYDVPYPFPLSEARPIGAAFAVALLLSPVPGEGRIARLELELRAGAAAPTLAPPALEALRQNTPAARSLPLLAALAGNAATDVIIGYLDDMALALTVTPGAA